jgi:PAS domain S-box-containing protein
MKSAKPKIRRTDAREKGSEKSDLFQTLTEKSLAGIYIVEGGRFRSINASAASYAGLKPEELINQKSDCILHPDDWQRVKHDARAMLRGERNSPHEFRIITRQGQIRWIMETLVSISYEGRPAILGNSMDITERKLAEEALQESKQRLADIIDFLPDATLAIDLQGKVIAWNRAIEEMTGVEAAQMLGKGRPGKRIGAETSSVVVHHITLFADLGPGSETRRHYRPAEAAQDLPLPGLPPGLPTDCGDIVATIRKLLTVATHVRSGTHSCD